MPDLKAKRSSRNRNDTLRARIKRVALGTAIGLGAMIAAGQSLGQTQDTSGWFTQEQAERGARTFVTECGGCHGYDLANVLAEGRSADTFYSFISSSMPWEDPGSLRPQQYADIVAFFLDELGFPEGDTELPPDREIMAQIDPANAGAASPDEPATSTEAVDASDTPEDVDADAVEEPEDEPDEEAADGSATTDTAPTDGTAPAGWFTAEQAEQGRRDFTIGCGGCHGGEMVGLFTDYDTAHEYYRFISSAMPADAPGSLGTGQYIAIIAYLMQEVGFPAGDEELTDDREVLSQIVPGEAPE